LAVLSGNIELVKLLLENGAHVDGCMAKDYIKQTAELIDGVDFEDEEFGLQLLEKSLASTHSVALWWD
jgi:ankyrin repeat protein